MSKATLALCKVCGRNVGAIDGVLSHHRRRKENHPGWERCPNSRRPVNAKPVEPDRTKLSRPTVLEDPPDDRDGRDVGYHPATVRGGLPGLGRGRRH